MKQEILTLEQGQVADMLLSLKTAIAGLTVSCRSTRLRSTVTVT
mgnify:CR=1 FL=1